MLTAIGAPENHPQRLPCCDSCDITKCPTRVRFESVVANGVHSKRKRRVALKKEFTEDCMANLRKGLMKAVEDFLDEHHSFKMLGRSFVCPDSVIEKICAEVRFFHSIDDFNIVGIRPEIKNRLYNVVSNVVSNAPPCKRSRHV